MDDTKRSNVPMHMDMPGWTKTYGGYADGRMKFGKHKLTARLGRNCKTRDKWLSERKFYFLDHHKAP